MGGQMRLSTHWMLGVAFFCGCSSPPTEPPNFPDANNIERIAAKIHGRCAQGENIPEFDVPPTFFEDLVRVLTPSKYHKRATLKNGELVADLRIDCRDGRVLQVQLIDLGQ